MAKRRNLGASAPEHRASVAKYLIKADESFAQVKRLLNQGNCSEAVDWLADGFEEVGMAEAHFTSGSGYVASDVRSASESGRKLLSEFKMRCTRGIRAGGSMRRR